MAHKKPHSSGSQGQPRRLAWGAQRVGYSSVALDYDRTGKPGRCSVERGPWSPHP